MPLHILLILVIGGIAGIALALHLLGMSNVDPLTEGKARHAWARAYPDSKLISVSITADGGAARITSDAGRGIVWQMGADTCARLLGAQTEAHVRGSKVILKLGDYTAPRISLRLTEQEQVVWADWITQT